MRLYIAVICGMKSILINQVLSSKEKEPFQLDGQQETTVPLISGGRGLLGIKDRVK
jgi:hypothetical protein